MRVATFNVNSIRARMPVLTRWLEEAQPDLVALQETKVEDGKFPLFDVEAAGYQAVFHGQQKYNGVALLTKLPVEDVATGFHDEAWPEDCRILRARLGGVQFLNTYVPNGTAVGTQKFEYKLAWFERFGRMVRDLVTPDEPVVWLGDINVAPQPQDVYDPARFEGSVGFHPLERAALDKLREWGWVDCFRKFQQEPRHYSYWDFFIPNGFKRNLGWRIDHIYASPGLVESCQACWIDKEPRSWERPSDHTPVIAEFSLG